MDTQSWQDPREGSDDDRLSEIKSALLNITDVFCAPLKLKVLTLLLLWQDPKKVQMMIIVSVKSNQLF